MQAANMNASRRTPPPLRQRGVVSIMFGLSLAVLIGFAGLAIDLGRFFVIKTELQNAVDACALAAASQLRPGQNVPTALTRAVAYGRTFSTGGVDDPATTPLEGNIESIKNRANLQSTVVDIQTQHIKFSPTLGPDSAYQTIDGGANYNTAAFVKCEYPMTGLPVLFMNVLKAFRGEGVQTQTVAAAAVATLAPSSTTCAIPAGICAKNTGSANFGFTPGEWITYGDKLVLGNFGWLDFTMTGGGTNDIRDLLKGSGYCTAKVGDKVSEYGKSEGAYQGWNSRFGLYKGSVTLAEAPPDLTGYAYYDTTSNSENSKTWAVDANRIGNAYSGSYGANKNYVYASNNHLPYQFPGADLTSAQHQALGSHKRVTVAPVLKDCTVKKVEIVGFACVLMLNPVLNSAKDTAQIEFLGLSTTAGSPCVANGEAGTYGPLVPQLVQ